MFKYAVDSTVANVKYLLHGGAPVDEAIELCMFLVELPEWIIPHVKRAVVKQIKGVKVNG